MPIKLRILLVVLVLGLLGFGVLSAYYASATSDTLSRLRTEQVRAIFEASAGRINSQTDLIERAARDLAVAGESLLRGRMAQPELDVDSWARDHLTAFVRGIPFATGAGIWFEPGALIPERRLFGPYAFWDKGRVTFTWELNGEQYDYPNQGWYLQGLPEDWPRRQPRPEPIYWTKPYYDEAGTHALMMTADAPMYGAEGELIGMATVDWSLEAMRTLVAGIHPTPGSRSFMVEKLSGRFVSFVSDAELVMQPIHTLEWAESLAQESKPGEIKISNRIRYAGDEYTLYSTATRIGLVFGVMMPTAEIVGDNDAFVRHNLMLGALLSIACIGLMLIALRQFFKPFQVMLGRISQSVAQDRVSGRLDFTPLVLEGRNEFTPIVQALNAAFGRVRSYTSQLFDTNQTLEKQRDEVERLNKFLEINDRQRVAELAASSSEMQSTLNELQAAQQKLVDAEKHAALNGLVAGIAHEVNTPLGVAVTACSHLQTQVLEFSERLANGQLTRSELGSFIQNSREGVEILARNLARAAQLIHGFKQISIDQSSEQRRRFKVKQYIDDIVLSLRPRLKKTPHEVVVDCPVELEVDSFPGAWSQILTNLLINSLTHAFTAASRGEMRIEVKSTADGIELRYSDNGCGVEKQDLDRLFQAYFTTRRDDGGSGLGLHIVKNLVTRTLHGQIRCESERGQGILFVISLPLLPAA